MKTVLKLVDACNRCSELLLLASVSTAEAGFQDLAQRLHTRFEQFEFELQAEIKRFGGNAFALETRSLDPTTDEPDILALRAEISLQLALDHYQQALNSSLSAHTRAMIKRQYAEIEQAYRELVSLHRAA